MITVVLLYLGSALFLLGLAHRFPRLTAIDTRGFDFLHRRLRAPTHTTIYRILWPFGRNIYPLLVLLWLYLVTREPIKVISLALTWLLAVLIEQTIKRHFKRPRPFTQVADARMLQPRQPRDPSFPSGDAMRVWLFTLALVFVAVIPAYLSAALLVVAVLVSLGRVALGVHYPADVIAGAGLGVTAFAIWFALIQ